MTTDTPCSYPSFMLSPEFIPTSSTDEDEYIETTRELKKSVTVPSQEKAQAQTRTQVQIQTQALSQTQLLTQTQAQRTATTNATASTTITSATVTTTAITPALFSTNPEGIRFVPQPPVQFYYSLHKNSLRTVIDTLLSAHELGQLCTIFKVPCYGRWLKKKKMVADLLVDFMLNLKQAYARDQFNELVDRINEMKGRAFLGRIPRLPNKIDAVKVLKTSLLLRNKIKRPTFPVRLNSPLLEVTGLIFLDGVDEPQFTMDLFFTLPPGIESHSNMRFILCIYQCTERISQTSSDSTTNLTLTPVSPTLLDLTLNGSILEQGNCRFRNHDSFDITLLCYKERTNLLRIIRHETHVDLSHLIVEVVAVNLAGSLSESRPVLTGAIKRPRDQSDQNDRINEEICLLREKYLKEDLVMEEVSFQASLSLLSKGFQQTNSDELEILEDCMKFSLKCPISFTRILQPVKFKSCRHGQCFDFSNWKQITDSILKIRLTSSKNMNPKYSTKVSCPICGEVESTGGKLISDGMFKIFLQTAGKDDVSVEINPKDGKYKFIQEDSDAEAETDDEIETVEIYNDNIDKSRNNTNIISLTDSDSDDGIEEMLTYRIDKTKPIGSCPSRAITID